MVVYLLKGEKQLTGMSLVQYIDIKRGKNRLLKFCLCARY